MVMPLDLRQAQGKIPVTGLSLKSGQIALPPILLELCGSAINPCLAFGKQPIDNAGQVTRHRLDCFGGSESGVRTSIARAQIAVTAEQRTGGQPQNVRHPILVFLTV
jgi:hypothetical protein